MHSCRTKFDIVAILSEKYELPRDVPFDYQLAMDRLRDFRAPRDKLRRLCESGEVIQVKRGLYLSGPASSGAETVDPKVLSGLIYGPSYLSLESALSQYGMIPERVTEFTCVSLKRGRVFATPVGRFRYRPIPERAFAVGLNRESASGGSYLIASPEKALCDRIALARELNAQREVPDFLFGSLRLEVERVADLDLTLVEEIAKCYRRNPVSFFAQWMRKRNDRRTPSFPS